MSALWVPRPLRWRDAWFCWRLARDPVVRAMSMDVRKPTVLGHLRWMARWVRGSMLGECMAWIVDVPVDDSMTRWGRAGLVRVHTVGHRTLEIGIALSAPYRAVGLGTEVIRVMTPVAGIAWGREVVARVKPSNAASASAFQRAGYRFVSSSTRDGSMVFEWKDAA